MKIIPAFFILSLAACTAKKPWTKDALVNDCLREFNKKNDVEKKFTGMQIPYICDCMSEKLVATYKSDAESTKDKAGVNRIATECTMEALSK